MGHHIGYCKDYRPFGLIVMSGYLIAIPTVSFGEKNVASYPNNIPFIIMTESNIIN
jgi:hypothetical protein